jgi:hypothetical protein
MQTLQELKNLIYDVEQELERDGLSASEVYLQSDYMFPIDINVRVGNYLGHINVLVETKAEQW